MNMLAFLFKSLQGCSKTQEFKPKLKGNTQRNPIRKAWTYVFIFEYEVQHFFHGKCHFAENMFQANFEN